MLLGESVVEGVGGVLRDDLGEDLLGESEVEGDGSKRVGSLGGKEERREERGTKMSTSLRSSDQIEARSRCGKGREGRCSSQMVAWPKRSAALARSASSSCCR